MRHLHVGHYQIFKCHSIENYYLGRENGRPPQLKAIARAGAKISTFWTEITRMHEGPALAYLAPLPALNTPATQLKFFKIFEQGFDPIEGDTNTQYL
jgi:AA9 family protein